MAIMTLMPSLSGARRTGTLLRPRFWGAGWLFSVLMAATLFLPAGFAHGAMDEGQVRAAVVSHIFSMTQWPQSEGQSGSFPKIILLGRDPAGIAAILANRVKDPVSAQGNIVHITALGGQENDVALARSLQTCQALYLTADGMQYLPQLQPLLADRPILTIGESAELCRSGKNMICLTIEKQRLVIHIHRQLASRRGFTFSAELLRHAVLTDGEAP